MLYKKYKPGDEFSVSADFLNGLADMLAERRGTSARPGQTRQATPFAGDVVLVKNTTGDNVQRFRIMALDAPIIAPADNADEYTRRVTFNGIKPVAASTGKWGVLIDGLTPNSIGRAVVIGVTVAWVNLNAAGDRFVEADPGAYIPKGNGSKGAQILWVAGGVGTASATGAQWATIRISPAAQGMFPVHVTKDGGTFTPTMTATYTVKDINDNDLADGTHSTSTTKTPEDRWTDAAAAMPFHAITDGSPGTAYYATDGALHLFRVAGEFPALRGPCSTA